MFRYLVCQRTVNKLFCLFVILIIASGCTSSSSAREEQSSNQKLSNGTNIIACGSSTCVSPPVKGLRPFIDTSNNIHLFQGFDYHIEDPAAIAKRYDFIWGATPDKVAAFRSANPNMLISYYVTLHRDGGPFSTYDIGIDSDGTVTDPELAKEHDLAYWKSTHPDWILYKCDRTTPAYEYEAPLVPLDFSNPDFIDWQIQTYAKPASEHGYDAIAADNVNAENLFGACGVYRDGKWVQLYSGKVNDPNWREDVLNWLTHMQEALHALPRPLALIPNLSLPSGTQANDTWVQEVIKHVDGVLDERGFTNYSHGYLTGDDWSQTLRLIETLQAQGKPYYSVNQFPSNPLSEAQVQWALASYLLAKEHLTWIAITSTVDGVQGYGDDRWRSEYAVSIGSPRGEMYYDQNVYWRDYTGGLIVANPSDTQSYTVTTQGSGYTDLYGKSIGKTFTLPPHSGLILLRG